MVAMAPDDPEMLWFWILAQSLVGQQLALRGCALLSDCHVYKLFQLLTPVLRQEADFHKNGCRVYFSPKVWL